MSSPPPLIVQRRNTVESMHRMVTNSSAGLPASGITTTDPCPPSDSSYNVRLSTKESWETLLTFPPMKINSGFSASLFPAASFPASLFSGAVLSGPLFSAPSLFAPSFSDPPSSCPCCDASSAVASAAGTACGEAVLLFSAVGVFPHPAAAVIMSDRTAAANIYLLFIFNFLSLYYFTGQNHMQSGPDIFSIIDVISLSHI